MMMTEKEIKISYAEICSNLDNRRLKPAFDLLGKLIAGNSMGIFYDEYRNLEENYHFILKYTVDGINDPERQKVYQRLIVSVFELAGKLYETLSMKVSSSVEYEKKRSFSSQVVDDINDYLESLEQYYRVRQEKQPEDEASYRHSAGKHHGMMHRLFYNVWFYDKLASEDVKPMSAFLLNPGIPAHYRSYIISAVFLSLIRFFDPFKFMLLFEAYDSEEADISQPALTGLLVNLYKYHSRMQFYPEITGRLKILNEKNSFKRNLEHIIIQFIRSKETEKLQQRIRDEILPQMIKISPNLKNKINLENLMEEGTTDDKNPDWEEILKDSPDLLSKMEEFSELQMKGADVFMGSFALLKSFPFYRETGNWFMPFFPENPDLTSLLDAEDPLYSRMMEALAHAPVLCNSDKYSLCFSIKNLPRENLEFLIRGIRGEMDQLKELQDDEALLDPGRRAGFVASRYIQDLYRFYKLYQGKNDFEDIFKWRFDFHNKQVLGDILKEDKNILRNISEYYFATGQFHEALEIFQYLLEQEKDGILYQKIAYCHHKTGAFETALENYLKAELYDINQLWNLKKIAFCYRNLRQPARALEYYREVEKIEPESLSNQLNIGHCLLELDKFEEALKCYFKVEYLEPGNHKVWRPIAWCSFLTGRKEQAGTYFLKLMELEPNRHDLMNMGHVQWSMGNRRAALDYYQKSISDNGFSMNEFLEVFQEDLPHLIRQGINNDDVPIMLDQLRYFLEE
jgi:tetratricopeptide (TPR) repeat protein